MLCSASDYDHQLFYKSSQQDSILNTQNETDDLLENFIDSEDKMIEIAYQVGTSKKFTSI